MTEEEQVQWARDWVNAIDQSPLVQGVLRDPVKATGVRDYADALRLAFPNVSDMNLGRLMVWISEFVIRAARMYGDQNATPRRLMFTFALTGRELLKLDADGSDPSGL